MKLGKLEETKPTICFSVELSPPNIKDKAESWALILPKSASAKLPSRGATLVEGMFNAIPFRAALEPDGKGSHCLRVNNTMRAVAGAENVDAVAVEITRIGDEPEIRMPMDFRKALAAVRLAQGGWEDITPLARRDWIFSITAEKRGKRGGGLPIACDMLASGKRRLCCFPGIKWMMKENAKACGMWLPLPSLSNHSSARSGK